MGSKRWMLVNGLGNLLRDEVPHAERFVDLFAGSGAVASFVAQKTNCPVVAYDVQQFCVALAGAVVTRTKSISPEPLWDAWHVRAAGFLKERRRYTMANRSLNPSQRLTQKIVSETRQQCAVESDLPITRAYGGHYFNRTQALWIDALRATLPSGSNKKLVALAALIRAASQCAAAPGHTAQPFQPTRTANQFLRDSWAKDICFATKFALAGVCEQFARVRGYARVADANIEAKTLEENDLVFIDPPYSGVHYSRFYHVLETIARGRCGEVTGVGRYPPPTERPRSQYSVASESREAISNLLTSVAARGATAVVTFPDKKCSNGISSYLIEKLGREYFRKVECKIVRGRFSTLGGNGQHRDARQPSEELVLILRP